MSAQNEQEEGVCQTQPRLLNTLGITPPSGVGGRPKTAELQVPGEHRGGRLQTRILCRCTEMVPGGRYFRICVASASADTAYSPLPHGRGGDGLPAPLKPGTRDADDSETGPVGSHAKTSSPRACSSTSRIQPARRASGSCCGPVRGSPLHLPQTRAPPVPSGPSVRRARAGHPPPTRPPILTWEERFGS